MDKDKLIEILQKLPKGTEIYVQQDDNAWPAKPRLFKANTGSSPFRLFLGISLGNHENFPERYGGAVEYDLNTHEVIKEW